jgi:hypothetical protein
MPSGADHEHLKFTTMHSKIICRCGSMPGWALPNVISRASVARYESSLFPSSLLSALELIDLCL